MNIAVIGLGSMGRRRIHLIKKFDDQIGIFGIDINDERRKTIEMLGISTFKELDEALLKVKIDGVFVCTSPLSHHKIIKECLERGCHIFTELNLVTDGYEENILLADKNQLKLFMSSTFLYREEIKYIKKCIIESKCPLNYTYHVGQYLPDWHPWESYKDFFVGQVRTNGCREIFAIELPWLVDAFGEVTLIQVMKSKMSSLEVDYKDNYQVLIQHKNGHKGMLAVDIVTRKPVRNLEIFGEDLYMSWDGSPIGLNKYNFSTKSMDNIALYDHIEQLESYSRTVVENAYFHEIEAFMNYVNNNTPPLYSFEQDKLILELIDRIES
ncbi:MAG: dehydrogenase [Erysipelotrichaceae bacterium]|nr:MAG: hypothetical protein FD179_961 [Erysipelotrichaceae bacterium]TXT18466.1 MAG: dehydrogenase [Erysipelotrichaceae bacterium]